MKPVEQDVTSIIASMEALDDLLQQQLEQVENNGSSEVDYLVERQCRDLGDSVGLESGVFNGLKGTVKLALQGSSVMMNALMKFADMMLRAIDTTHLTKVRHLRREVSKLSDRDLEVSGSISNQKLAQEFLIGEEPAPLEESAKDVVNFARQLRTQTLVDQASISRQLGQIIKANRHKGHDLFVEEVDQMVRVIGSAKLPVELPPAGTDKKVFIGNRIFLRSIRPNIPRVAPTTKNTYERRLVQSVSSTDKAFVNEVTVKRNPTELRLPILSISEIQDVLGHAEEMLIEARHLARATKSLDPGSLPSGLSLALSGLLSKLKTQVGHFWEAHDDGYDVIEGASGGGAEKIRHKPGTRNPLGGLVKEGQSVRGEDQFVEDTKMITSNDVVLARWVSFYTRLSLVDTRRTSQLGISLLVQVALSYIEYADRSLDYYRQ